jgi:ACR3 family arsenite transporter
MHRYQLPIYVLALGVGISIGFLLRDSTEALEAFVWPALGALLYATFCDVHPLEAARAFRDTRFLAASLLANFVAIPLFVWLVAGVLIPLETTVKLGVFMVLLVPCTDWFITFVYLGKGSARLAIALTPVQLLLQLALLPLYLWMFLGGEYTDAVSAGPFLSAFAGLIVLPFLLAFLTQLWAERRPEGARWLRTTTRLSVPLLSVTILLIAASQAQTLADTLDELAWPPAIFILYLLVAALLARLLSSFLRLDVEAGRTLAFNVGTRNSFVVLPLALALPAGWEPAVAVIVMQSFVELAGMIGYLWWVPNRLFPARP